jgi:flagellar protein FliS
MRGIQQYKSTALETAPNETLLLLLLETALDRLDQAIEALEGGDKKSCREHLAFARSAYSELIISLDHEVAPEISQQLNRLYLWCIRELAKAGSLQDVERIQSVRKITASMLETWSEAVEKAR